jgi:DNA-binding CsgD family transcriptional regulator/tetratricopeptide (TPR) repeat protein
VKTAQETGGAQLDELGAGRLELLEREAELSAFEALLGDASSRGRLLAIEGPPGIGKTSLILEARERAQRAGMEVLSARGSELESTFSFGVVRQLFEPFFVQLSEDDRAELLAGAAELATSLFEPAQLAAEPGPDASLASLHGLYWLTANVAARRPLLLAVDDLHWCDRATLRWLAYVLPRLDGLDLLIVVGLRPTETGADPAVLGQILSDPLTTVIRLAPLSSAGTTQLLRQSLSPDADESFCIACHEITGGNPLLVHELVGAILTAEVEPAAASVSGLSELAARAGWRAVSVRLSRLPPETTSLAQAVAILGDEVDPRQAARLADLSDEEASQATADLVRVDVLRARPPLNFMHPLIRGAVYETLTPLERSSGHARAAQLLSESGAEPERIATHLLLVPPGLLPSEGTVPIVSVLEDAARNARSSGASESAVAYLRRALAEPPRAAGRADRLLELASAEAFVNGEAAVEHLQEAHRLIDDPVRRAQAAVQLGRQLFYLGRIDDSIEVFTSALEELAGADAELERLLEAGLISSGIFEAPLREDVVRRLDRLRRHPPDGSPGKQVLLALLAFFDARACAPASESVALARRALAGGTLLEADDAGGAFLRACIVLTMADLDEALHMWDAALAAAHLRGSVAAFASCKIFRAHTFLKRGELAEAEVDGRESFEARKAWGLHLLDVFNYVLADALLEQGKVEEAAAALKQAGWRTQAPENGPVLYLRHTGARLLLLTGDLEGALAETLDAGGRFEAIGGHNPAFMPWRSQAALALMQLGEQDDARRLAAEELELARTWGASRALGAALRVAGLAKGGSEGLALLEEAVATVAGSPAKLEHAKARTELGAALRRANRRSDAREHLRRAVELATICGATPLVARAETELLATGARPRRVALSGIDSLTPSERRVAEMAAEGPTNREIAQALFVTPKTVEVHLSSAYRKLRISSRSQLAAALAGSGS